MRSIAIAAAGLTLATALGSAVAQPASREPTVSDIAACNEEAFARTGGGVIAPPGTASRPRSPETARPLPDSRDGAPSASPPGEGSTQLPPVAPRRPDGGSVGEKTDPSGTLITQSPDPLLKGMDAEKADDPGYRAAYRSCMNGRMSGAR